MKHLILSLVLSLSSIGAWAFSLRPGDVLLQPLDCWSCTLIESEEETIYSHMGVVVSVGPVFVAESLGKVRALPLEEFNSRTEKGQRLAVLRLKDPGYVQLLNDRPEAFLDLFQESFLGKKYDHDFLWDNVDETGEELLYCSEFVAKFFRSFFGDIKTPIKRMHFSRNPEVWERYFRGKVPVGKWGNSPGDFERSPLFEKVGEI